MAGAEQAGGPQEEQPQDPLPPELNGEVLDPEEREGAKRRRRKKKKARGAAPGTSPTREGRGSTRE